MWASLIVNNACERWWTLVCFLYLLSLPAPCIQTWKQCPKRILCSMSVPWGKSLCLVGLCLSFIHVSFVLKLVSVVWLITWLHGNLKPVPMPTCNMYDFMCLCFKPQEQFKSQGTRLIPTAAPEQALTYQRMFEGVAFMEKMGRLRLLLLHCCMVLHLGWVISMGTWIKCGRESSSDKNDVKTTGIFTFPVRSCSGTYIFIKEVMVEDRNGGVCKQIRWIPATPLHPPCLSPTPAFI